MAGEWHRPRSRSCCRARPMGLIGSVQRRADVRWHTDGRVSRTCETASHGTSRSAASHRERSKHRRVVPRTSSLKRGESLSHARRATVGESAIVPAGTCGCNTCASVAVDPATHEVGSTVTIVYSSPVAERSSISGSLQTVQAHVMQRRASLEAADSIPFRRSTNNAPSPTSSARWTTRSS